MDAIVGGGMAIALTAPARRGIGDVEAMEAGGIATTEMIAATGERKSRRELTGNAASALLANGWR